MKTSVRIIHISDLHFGKNFTKGNGTPNIKVLRNVNETFSSMCDSIAKQHEKKEIDFLVISGDLSYSGQEKEFIQDNNLSYLKKDYPILTVSDFVSYFKNSVFGSKKRSPKIILCPGNHDKFHESYGRIDPKKFERQSDKKKTEIERSLSKLEDKDFKMLNGLEGPFNNYSNFCKKIKADKPILADAIKSYLNGYLWYPEFNIVFVILNSAWLSFPHKRDFGDLSVGNNFVRQIYSQIPKLKPELVISVFHHPYYYLKWGDRFGSPNEYNPIFPYISNLSQLILTGHEHANISSPDLLYNISQVFLSGASYEEPKHKSDFYFNAFLMLDIDFLTKSIKRTSFELSAITGSSGWKGFEDPSPYNYHSSKGYRDDNQQYSSDPWKQIKKEHTHFEYKNIKEVFLDSQHHYHCNISSLKDLDRTRTFISTIKHFEAANKRFHIYVSSNIKEEDSFKNFSDSNKHWIDMNKILIC
jgi:hypothetical protein